MQGVGAVFGLPFKSQGWFGTFGVMGLIALIPIIGWINLLGWELTCLDNYRQGRTDLPPAGLRYVGRGGTLFGVLLVWAIPVFAVIGIGIVVLFISIGAATAASSGSSASSDAAGASIGGGIALFYLFLFVGILFAILLQVLQPAIIIATERRGFSGGVSPSYVLSIARQNWGHTLLAAVLFYAGSFLGSLGTYACYVGIIFTLAYASAVQAGVLRYYEYSLDPQGAPPPTPPVAQPIPPAPV